MYFDESAMMLLQWPLLPCIGHVPCQMFNLYFYTLYIFHAAGRQTVYSDMFTTDLHLR